MITRRNFMKASIGAGLGLVALGSYALGIEPAYRLRVVDHNISPKNWPRGFNLTIAMVADIHAGGYNMPLSRVEEVVEQTNALKCDLIVFMGDCLASYKRWGYKNPVKFDDVADRLTELKAPLGVYSVLGNHDWWDDNAAQERMGGPTLAHIAFKQHGLRVLENDAIRLTHKGQKFWLAGLGDQLAFPRFRAKKFGVPRGVDDLSGTLAKMKEKLPTIMLAHEPHIFSQMSDKVDVTLSGHTHGGQVNLFGLSALRVIEPLQKYIYGHYSAGAKNLIVSGGLGCSHMPLRLGVPPEITRVIIRA